MTNGATEVAPLVFVVVDFYKLLCSFASKFFRASRGFRVSVFQIVEALNRFLFLVSSFRIPKSRNFQIIK